SRQLKRRQPLDEQLARRRRRPEQHRRRQRQHDRHARSGYSLECGGAAAAPGWVERSSVLSHPRHARPKAAAAPPHSKFADLTVAWHACRGRRRWTMRGTQRSREELIREDVRDLRRLGYVQQLYREMGGFSNFAISFSIISILTGAIQLFGYGLQFAGPVVNTYGWPLVSVFVLCVAASMAELASAYPTAGGLYFWAHRLGGRRWAWITAWFNMIGQVTITAGIDYAAAQYIVGAVNRI